MNVPSTIEIYESIENDLRSKLDLPDDQFRLVLNAMSSVLAAQLKLAYLRIEDVRKQLYPDTADLAINGGELERLGLLYLNRQPNPATQGVYQVAVTAEANAQIRANLTFKSNEDSTSPGVLYTTDSETTLTGSSDIIEIRSFDGGPEFILNPGDQLTITEPVLGVDQLVTVTEITETPISSESTAAYRQAILDAIQLEPQGGARTDYRLWAADAQGVRKVYPYVKSGSAGTVQVFVEANVADSSDGEGTPSQSILDEVAEVIEFDPDDTKPTNERGRRPIQAILEVLPITLVPVDVDIAGLSVNTVEIQTAIQDNLKAYLLDIRPYIAGADLSSSRNDILYAFQLTSVVTDVLDGDNFFTEFTMQVNGNAETSSQFSGANIPYLRNLTFS